MSLDLLQSVRSRADSGVSFKGIGTADFYLRQFEQCVGGSCPSQYFKDVSAFRWRKGLEASAKRLVYHHPLMDVDGDFFSGEAIKAAAAKFGDLPPHTIAAFNAVITTTRQDRDGDILETAGASIDPKSPLLYQHMPFENCGRLLQEGKHTSKSLSGALSICNTPLGEDVALLTEHGALRISHGFAAEDYEPIEGESGFHILKFNIMEVSLVSIPSNPDAEVTMFSRDKLHSPLAKAFAEAKFKSRPVVSAVSIDVASLASSLPAGTSVTFAKSAEQDKQGAACGCKSHKAGSMSNAMGVKSVVPYKKTPASDSDTWDADKAEKGLRSWAGVDGDDPSSEAFGRYKQGFGIVDGDAENLTSYKYPHHEASDGKLTVNRKALGAVIAAINGGRGGSSLSESDRKGLYNHISKHYRDSFPDDDVPELKCVAPLRYKGKERDFFNAERTKGVYVEFENSFDDIRQDLNDALLSYLIANGVADSGDCCYIVDLFLYQAIVQVMDRDYLYGYAPYSDDATSYYVLDWEMGADEEPVWSGVPQHVEITPQITALDKRARSMFLKSLPAKHVRSLSKAMGHCSFVADHDDATKAVKTLATKAKNAIQEVHDAHAGKGVGMSQDQQATLEKAMGYCSKGADHDEATDDLAKRFKSAGTLVKSVMEGDMSGEESLESLIVKSGRKVSAANESKLKSAAANFKAISDDDEAYPPVAELAKKGYTAIKGIFSTGGDDGSDMNAYTDGEGSPDDAGKSAHVDGEKAGRAISKQTEATIREAIGHGKGVIAHEKATSGHKALARKSVAKLKGVIGDNSQDDTEGGEDDADGSLSLHGGNPLMNDEGKSVAARCKQALAAGLIEYAISGHFDDLKGLREFANEAIDTTTRIEKQNQYQAESALIEQALAAI